MPWKLQQTLDCLASVLHGALRKLLSLRDPCHTRLNGLQCSTESHIVWASAVAFSLPVWASSASTLVTLQAQRSAAAAQRRS